MKHRVAIQTVLGGAIWLVAIVGVTAGLNRVRARAARATHIIRIAPAVGHGLAKGDIVYFQTVSGLKRAGEVATVTQDRHMVKLAILADVAPRLNDSARATCWRTPLTAENAINALLPPVVQQRVADQLTDAWRLHEGRLAEIWGPLIGELARAYLNEVGNDLEAAVERHSDELWTIAQAHGDHLLMQWPVIQGRLSPLLRDHLTPVLGRLMHEAADHAPKMRIAWSVARGDSEAAFRHVLDSLAEYLANMPDDDRTEMAAAVRNAWEAAGRDEVLTESLGLLGHAILEDQDLRRVLNDIYREAVVDNPRTEAFFRTEILDSPQVRQKIFASTDIIGPTLQRVAAICLFDESGATRPEVVHLVRSIALRRRVSWVTLENVEAGGEPLPPNALIHARMLGPAS